MNFEELYSRVFIKEAETEPLSLEEPGIGTDSDTDIPTPDKYDVEPMPVNTNVSVNGEEKLRDYVSKFEEFLDLLNGVSGDSVQQFVNDMDKERAVFQGISDTSRDIVKLAGQTANLIQVFNGYISTIKRRKRELAITNIS